MDSVKVISVRTRSEMNDFIRLTDRIYGGCEQYVPDVESETRHLFQPASNPGLAFCDIQPFVAYRGSEPVGRIVAIVNRHANEHWKVRNVRFSMVEFIDDEAVSEALLDAVAQWGRSRGMDTIQGPMGISDFDKEGMLVEDFQLTGSMTSYYNHAYYPKHLERLGFSKEVDWLQVRIEIPKEVPARYARVAQYARDMIGLRVVKVSARDVLKGDYGRKIFELLNVAYAPIFGFTPMTEGQARHFLNAYVPLLDMQLVPLVENADGELVGLAVTLPSLAEALRRSNGRLWPLGWWHLLRALRWHHADNLEMLLVAVRPDYQGLGVNALFFDDLIPIYNRCGYRWAETGPQLEDNIKELTQWKPLHPEFVKRRRCYQKKLTIDN